MKDCNKIYPKKRKSIFLKNDQIWGTLIVSKYLLSKEKYEIYRKHVVYLHSLL